MPRLPLFGPQTKRVFKQACEQYDLVYFGTVSQHSDEHQMVRGFALSPSHVDRHYCVGTVSGRDVIMLERTDTISFPSAPSKSYSWLIIQIDLRQRQSHHIVLNSFTYDQHVYTTLFAKLSHLHRHDASALTYYDQAFRSKFHVYMSLQHSDSMPSVISADAAQILGHHFAGLDFEIIDDALIVYQATQAPTSKMIEHVLKAGIWLADQLDLVN